ncbi:hypothetical protein J2X69_002607 [Algoriphagus sp. 4150]|nr:hypothetical protein [Algoriphagus sp. 4150]
MNIQITKENMPVPIINVNPACGSQVYSIWQIYPYRKILHFGNFSEQVQKCLFSPRAVFFYPGCNNI